MRKGRDRGFTLLEIMLVLVIVTLMMSMLFRTMQAKAAALRIQRTAQQIQTFLTAAQNYYIQNRVWPGSGGPGRSMFNPATVNVVADLVDGGFLAATVQPNWPIFPSKPLNPWGQYYYMCPFQPGGVVEVIQCPAPATFPANSPNIGFYTSLPSLEIANEIAALIPNGLAECSAPNSCKVQGMVLGPSEMLNQANYVKNIQSVQAFSYDPTHYQPKMSSKSAIWESKWPPTACPWNQISPLVHAPTGPDCPQGWVPQIYVAPMGLTSSAPSAVDPITGSYVLPSLSGFFLSVVTICSGGSFCNGYQTIIGPCPTGTQTIGWDIFGTAIQPYNSGVQSTQGSPVVPSAMGGVQSIQPAVTVMTKCVPPAQMVAP